jgi:predicted esterase
MAAAVVASACDFTTEGSPPNPNDARLSARPGTPTASPFPSGFNLIWAGFPSAHLLVPQGFDSSRPAPLVVGLHGANGTADGHRSFLGPYAESNQFLLLIPDSRGYTWDGILGFYSSDIATIDRALKETFRRFLVDPARIVLEGFSDGASYALGVGIVNGDLFGRVVAFSPGFVTETKPAARKPSIFISHGRQDPILPIDRASRLIVPQLRQGGFTVDYHEFDGQHEIPADIAQLAVDFMLEPA